MTQSYNHNISINLLRIYAVKTKRTDASENF